MTNKHTPWMMIIICFFLLFSGGCQKAPGEIQEEIQEPVKVTPDTPQLQQGGKIKISMRIPKSLNPILNTDKTVDQTLKLVFDTLVDFDENDQVIPHIAKAWTSSEGGTVVDIQLNNDIKWHDGTPLTAKDVEFSLKSIQDASESPYKPCVKNIISYNALADDKIRIVYKEPFSGYAATLYFPVIPAHVNQLDSHPVGSGPYKFQSSLATRQMDLIGNPNYFKGAPNIPLIEVLFTPDPESDLYSFDQGLIDVVSTDVIDWEKYGKNKKSYIHEYTTRYYDYIGLNFNRPALQDIKLRQALLYATNREYLLEKIYLYHGVVSDVPVSPLSWLYDPQSKQYESDVKKAKELLEGKTATLGLLVNKENGQRTEVAKALQKMYKEIGITLEIIELDEVAFIDRVTGGKYDMFLGGWNLSIIPDLSFAFHSANIVGGANYGGYVNSEMDQLLKNAFVAKDDEKLQEAYSKLQMHISNKLPYLSLYFRTSALITNEKIIGDVKPHHMNAYQNIHQWYVKENTP